MSPEDDQRANRTLFLGNLDITVTDQDLRRAFDRFGVITEVDIKRAVRGQNSTYGFLKFENLDMALVKAMKHFIVLPRFLLLKHEMTWANHSHVLLPQGYQDSGDNSLMLRNII